MPPTTVHKCEPRATQSLARPQAVRTRIKNGVSWSTNDGLYSATRSGTLMPLASGLENPSLISNCLPENSLPKKQLSEKHLFVNSLLENRCFTQRRDDKRAAQLLSLWPITFNAAYSSSAGVRVLGHLQIERRIKYFGLGRRVVQIQPCTLHQSGFCVTKEKRTLGFLLVKTL
ncbi:hypothetical protein AVEN_33557-1 [Araneus ventricosus]|uniref:Uncharacterized protein n=1 Tax=Araneus ventricosus TaxID=182803 RepID=A0A4Y2EQW3_ARAVE|nr:hypothetical protein AVEN_95787-1 [Araneus ventricosus]GBM30548.1 hypothetical protein AVEN_33557-1 [Araneus ventricosus]